MSTFNIDGADTQGVAASRRPHCLREVVEWGAEYGNTDAFLREFMDEFYAEPDRDTRQAMLREIPPMVARERTNAYLGAVAEHLCFRYGIEHPAWASQAERFLRRPYFPSGLESLKASLLKESPTAFRRRMIFVGADPLYRPRRDYPAFGLPFSMPFVQERRKAMTPLLSKDDILRVFGKIDGRAVAAHVMVDLSVYGGAALALAFDMREATRDVDAVVRGNPDFLRTAVAQIAAEEGWPKDWLNDGVKGFTSSKEQMYIMEAFQAAQGTGLRIHMPSAEYLFAMNCMTMRPDGVDGSQDKADIEALADAANIPDADSAIALVEDFYPAGLIMAKVRFGVEEIMENVVARRKGAAGPKQ